MHTSAINVELLNCSSGSRQNGVGGMQASVLMLSEFCTVQVLVRLQNLCSSHLRDYYV